MRRYLRRLKYRLPDLADAARRRWNNLLRPAPWLNGRCGQYHLVSKTPPILYLGHWSDYGGVKRSMTPLFDRLRDLPLTVVVGYFWQIEDERRVQLVKRMYDIEHRRRCPYHRVLHVCNTPRQFEMFRGAGMRAVYSSRAALADERIYRPLPSVVAQQEFDAVYDARLQPYKRHHLAVGVSSLALLHAHERFIGHQRHVRETVRMLPDAHYFNGDPRGPYRKLDPETVNEAYNRCRVGLCLSQTEGVMFSSIQYLLAGLPVVSTRSGGGRDVFYDDRVALIVDDDPRAVGEGVAEMIRRDLDSDEIRTSTLKKVNQHRQRLTDALQAVYDEHGIERRITDDWPAFYVNKLCQTTQHIGTLAVLGR